MSTNGAGYQPSTRQGGDTDHDILNEGNDVEDGVLLLLILAAFTMT